MEYLLTSEDKLVANWLVIQVVVSQMLATFIMLKMPQLGAYPVFCDTKQSDFFHLGKMLENQDYSNKNAASRVAATPNQVAGLLRTMVKLMNSRY